MNLQGVTAIPSFVSRTYRRTKDLGKGLPNEESVQDDRQLVIEDQLQIAGELRDAVQEANKTRGSTWLLGKME